MQQQVAILLNEREPQKKEISDALEEELSRDGITTSRIQSSPNLAKEVIAAKPSVVIVDYILEDYGTGLDLLERCIADDELHRPDCIFFTDEPSLQVAIAAMKLGAMDYLLSTDVHSFSECISLVKSSLAKKKQTLEYRKSIQRWRNKKELVLASEEMTVVFEALISELQKGNEAIVLLGDPGAGKKTLARILINEMGRLPLAIQANHETAPFQKILARSLNLFENYSESESRALPLFEDVVFETVSIAKDFLSNLSSFAARLEGSPFPFFVTTCDPRVAKIFEISCKCFVARIPNLEGERVKELGQLVQKFLFEAASTFKQEMPKFTAKELKWFSEQEWKGNLSQLKRVIETFTASQKKISGDSVEEKLARILEIDNMSSHSLDQLEDLRKMPEAIFETLIQARGDLRECSRLLGCSVAEILDITQEYR